MMMGRTRTPRTALYLDFDAPPEVDMSQNAYSDPDAGPFLRDCLLGRSLSAGSFGAAFRIARDANDNGQNDALVREWVIKLPRALLKHGLYPRDDTSGPDVYLGDAIETMGVSANTRNRAFADFEAEFENAEAILEPPTFRRANQGGGRIVRMLAHNWDRLMDQRDQWKALAGYKHLHPVLHYEASLPALISARADGTLFELRQERFYLYALCLQPNGDAHGVWYDLARQITSAVTFILACTPLAHIDIKLSNIFFTRIAAGQGHTVLLQLGDYGMCRPKEDTVGRYTWNGTPPYNPLEAPGRLATITYAAQSVFQLAASLFAILRMPPPRGGGGPARVFPGNDGRLICQYAIEEDMTVLKADSAPQIVCDMLRVDPFAHGADDALRDRLFRALKDKLGVTTPVYMQRPGERRPRDTAP